MDKQLVVVFARAARYGAVKSRLARDLGPLETLRFYRTTLARILRTIGTDPRWQTTIALTPDAAVDAGDHLTGGLRLKTHGGGDLGARMVRALRGAGARPALIIGSDIPDITPARISAAFRALGRAPFVLGPAADGGYWLIGARHPERLPRNTLAGIRWSSVHARADTIAALGADRVAILPFELEDIDDVQAHRRWRARSAARGTAQPIAFNAVASRSTSF
jgi:rSAM/selenodomain-associated transferase 1